MNTQRGCPFTCNWCSHAVYGDTYRRRPVKSVIAEIKELIVEYNPDSFWFVDDVFTMSEKWLMDFQQELQANHLKIKYECITRADRLNEKIIKTLKNTGCEMLWIGAESGSQKVIDLMDRRVDIKVVREMIKRSKNQGIKTGTFIMLGYPGETSKDIQETIYHLKESNPDIFTINIAYPIRGTKLFEDVKEKIVPVEADFETIDRNVDFKRTYNRKYYDYAIRKVYNEVNYHKYKLNKKNVLALKCKLKSATASIGMIIYK
ncbi:MAG: radical SAM protein [Bacteroidales bacterium]